MNFYLQFLNQAKFDVFAQSMKCFNVNPNIILNLTCKMTPIRGKCGLIFISATLARVEHPFARIQLFYRFTGGFRPYLIDLQLDGCEVASMRSSLWQNKAGLFFLNILKGIYPSIFRGCPYGGQYDSNVFDLNATISPLLPPVVSAGVYRARFDFWFPPNVSIVSVQGDVLVKAQKEYRVVDFSFLNMG